MDRDLDENDIRENERLLWEHRDRMAALTCDKCGHQQDAGLILAWAKSEIARKRGSIKSEAKSNASRLNGLKGGRPKKQAQ